MDLNVKDVMEHGQNGLLTGLLLKVLFKKANIHTLQLKEPVNKIQDHSKLANIL